MDGRGEEWAGDGWKEEPWIEAEACVHRRRGVLEARA